MRLWPLPLVFSQLLAIIGCLASWHCAAEDITAIAINEDLLYDYTLFVNNRDLSTIDYYGGKGARRDVIDLVLLRQALLAGGFTKPIELQIGRSYLRTMRDIVDGTYITSANQMWMDDISPLAKDLYVSHPLIKSGEFIVGIYTNEKNTKALAAKSLKALSQLTAVTSSQWTADVRSLQQLGFKQILFSPNWVNMVRMINAGRADVTLAPFQQTPNMAVEVNGMKLVPIQGVKVGIDGTRHWGVSRKHAQGKLFYDALERGLNELQLKGVIQRAYRECGFYHPDIASWTLLVSPQPAPAISPTPSTTTPD